MVCLSNKRKVTKRDIQIILECELRYVNLKVILHLICTSVYEEYLIINVLISKS